MGTGTDEIGLDDDSVDFIFKVLVTGEPGVGKTSLIRRYVEGYFTNNYKSTIGVDFSYKQIKWDEKTNVRLQLWDLAGQDRINVQTRTYFKETNAALCVCDVTRPQTIVDAKAWFDAVQERSMDKEGNPLNPPCILVLNKMDNYQLIEHNNIHPFYEESMFDVDEASNVASDPEAPRKSQQDKINEYREKIQSKVNELAEDIGFVTSRTTSVKNNIGIDDVFRALISECLKHDRGIEISSKPSSDIIHVGGTPAATRGSCSGYC